MMVKAITPFDPEGYIEEIPHSEYLKLSDADVLQKLRYRHLLITGLPNEGLEFNAQGVHMIGSFNRVFTIHGSYISFTPFEK
jgi:hypothetical protein